MSPMNPRLLRPRSGGVTDPAFDPTSISGLVSWYAMNRSLLYQDTAGTIQATANNDPVAYVQDLSGNGRHLLTVNSSGTQVNASRPLLKTKSLNQRATLFYDGSNDYLTHNSNPTTYSGVCVFVVTNHLSAATGNIFQQRMIFGATNTTSDGYFSGDQPWVSGTLAWQPGASVVVTDTRVLTGPWTLLTFRASPTGGSSISVNGTAVKTSGNVSSVTMNSRFTLGALWMNGSVERFANGGFAELLVYHADLSSSNISSVNDYLKQKYAL